MSCINESFLKEIPLRRALIVHFIRPWTCPILEKYNISWTEFESKFVGCDEAGQKSLLNRKTNPVHFVKTLRDQESKGRCAIGYYTTEEIFFNNANRIQVVNFVFARKWGNLFITQLRCAECLHSSQERGVGTSRPATACCPAAAAKCMALLYGASTSKNRSSLPCRAAPSATPGSSGTCVAARVDLPQVIGVWLARQDVVERTCVHIASLQGW